MINTNEKVVLPVGVYNWLNKCKIENWSLRACLMESPVIESNWLMDEENETLFAWSWVSDKYTYEKPKKYHVMLNDMGSGFTRDEKDLYLVEYEGGGMYEFVTLKKKINKEFFLGRIEFTEEEVSGVIKDMGFARFAKEIK